MAWLNDLPDGAWGLLGVLVGGGIATWTAWWLRRREGRADLARENRREVYEPALAELRSMNRVLHSGRFPTRITFDPSASRPSELLPTGDVSLDISWWEELKDRGAHLRIAPSIREVLEGVEELCSAYCEAHLHYLNETRATLFELMKSSQVTTASAPEHEHFLLGAAFRTGIAAYLLRGDDGKDDLVSALTNAFHEDFPLVQRGIELLGEVSSLEKVHIAAKKLESGIAAADADLVRHLNEILKKHDVQDESV